MSTRATPPGPPPPPPPPPPPSQSPPTVGVRQLRNQVAAVLRRAGAGERIVVTADGAPVAQLGPIEPDRTGVTLWDLAGAGLVEPPRRPDRPDEPTPITPPADVRIDRLLDAARRR